jgi:phospholipid/cholesterol/gamma-HCH transport system permease protein
MSDPNVSTWILSSNFDYPECLRIMAAYKDRRNIKVCVNGHEVKTWPITRSAILADVVSRLEKQKIEWIFEDIPEETLRFIAFTKSRRNVSAVAKVAISGKRNIYRLILATDRFLKMLRYLLSLMQDMVYWTVCGPFIPHGFRYSRTLYEITSCGMRSVGIVLLVSFIMGLILAMQGGAQLERLGAAVMVAKIVGMVTVREIGPLLASLLVTGRCGSAITAEIGAMVTSEEMDALRAMGISITKYVVVPKFVALIIILPCLTLFANIVCIYGSYVFSYYQLGVSTYDYFNQTVSGMHVSDVFNGLAKSLADAVIIAYIAVYHGLTTKGGAEGIGSSTTRSVVVTIIWIALAHLFFTVLFYYNR